MLLLEHPRRLSTDVDIIVPQGTDVESYLKKVKDVFPFEKVVQQERIGKMVSQRNTINFIINLR